MTDLINLQAELEIIKTKKSKAIDEHEFETAAILRDKERQLLLLIQSEQQKK